MKKLLFFAVVVLFSTSAAQAQQNVLKLNIFSPIVKTANFSFERTLSSSSSLQLGVAYTGASISETKLRGIQLTPEYRFYLSDTDAPDGFYAAPFLRYSNLSLEEEELEAKADATSFGGGLVFGRQWIFKSKIGLEVFLGPSFSSTSIDVKSGEGEENQFDVGAFDGFGVRFGVNFGFAF